jgi:hypothetical protein
MTAPPFKAGGTPNGEAKREDVEGLSAMKTGDVVSVTYEGRTATVTVALASPDGRSLMLSWEDGMLGAHCGLMLVLQDDSGAYHSLLEDRPVIFNTVAS